MDNLIIGCGYLGLRVAALWRAQGLRVYATTRRQTSSPAYVDLGLEPILCDVLDPPALPAVATVLYAVGFDRASGAAMGSVYVDGLARVLDRLPAPARFVYVSSSSVYGQTDGSWVDEDAATEPEEESGKIVLAAEQVLRARRPEALILRFAGIYGPGRLLRQGTIQAGEPIVGSGEKWLNLIQVDDGARLVLAAEENGQPGRTYNVCDDRPVRRHDFYRALARHLKAPEPRFVAPPAGAPAPPHEKANRRISNRRMKEELGVQLRFSNYEDGIRAAL